MTFRFVTKMVTVQVRRASFAFIGGCDVLPNFLGTLGAAAQADLPLFFSLTAQPQAATDPHHAASALTNHRGLPGAIAADGWRCAVSPGCSVLRVALLTKAV